MPLVTPKHQEEKIQIAFRIDKALLTTVEQYCEWAGVKRKDEFFVQAAAYLLLKDREWVQYEQNQKSHMPVVKNEINRMEPE